MKKSNLMLISLAAGLLVSMTAANITIKKTFDRLDKTDPFWNYQTMLTGSFSHIKITDNKSTWIKFRPGPHGSMGILSDLANEHRVEASIANDTLFVKILQPGEKPGMRDWLSRNELVCITTPQLRSVTGSSAEIVIKDLAEKTFNVELQGNSNVEVESVNPDFDTISVNLRDSSSLKFEMAEEIPSSGLIHAKCVKATLAGNSTLDVGHIDIANLEQIVSARSSIGLSGKTLQILNK